MMLMKRERWIFAVSLLSFIFLATSCSLVQDINETRDLDDFKQDALEISTPVLHNFTVIDIESMDLSHEELLVLASIEGLVNKHGAHLYVVYENQVGFNMRSVDLKWQDYLSTLPECNMTMFNPANLSQVIQHFQAELPGSFENIIIIDGEDIDAAQVATPLCGVTKSLLIPQQLYSSLAPYIPSTIAYNITEIFASNDLTTRVEKFEYAFENFFPLCNQSALTISIPEYPINTRDFCIKNDIFTLWDINYVDYTEDDGAVRKLANGTIVNATVDSDAELALFEKVLEETDTGIPVFGFAGTYSGVNEGRVISRISGAGKYCVVSRIIHNLAFWQGLLPPANYTFQQQHKDHDITLRNKIYACGVVGDGDNIGYCWNHLRLRTWDQLDRGNVPVGYTLSPSLHTFAPYIMKYYYENATPNDYFMCGPSGAGYAYPRDMTSNDLHQYLDITNQLFQASDLHEIFMLGLGDDLQALPAYAAYPDIHAIFDYTHHPRREDPELHGNTTYFRCFGRSDLPGDGDYSVIKDLDALKQYEGQLDGPIFCYFNLGAWDFNASEWKLACDYFEGDPRVEFVTPNVFVDLYKQSLQNQAGFTQRGLVTLITITVTVGTFALAIALNTDSLKHGTQGKSKEGNR
ncbi:hypothetical protein GF325_00605 [Candidatus Bathyarchaeota archaeon]|nr:hypothetical protein [Candidatus Bathyarchaeota archaeon]